jgi:hypothetical protein
VHARGSAEAENYGVNGHPYSGEKLLGAFLDPDPASSYPARSDFTQLNRMARTTANDAQSATMKSALPLPRRSLSVMPLAHFAKLSGSAES